MKIDDEIEEKKVIKDKCIPRSGAHKKLFFAHWFSNLLNGRGKGKGRLKGGEGSQQIVG